MEPRSALQHTDEMSDENPRKCGGHLWMYPFILDAPPHTHIPALKVIWMCLTIFTVKSIIQSTSCASPDISAFIRQLWASILVCHYMLLCLHRNTLHARRPGVCVCVWVGDPLRKEKHLLPISQHSEIVSLSLVSSLLVPNHPPVLMSHCDKVYIADTLKLQRLLEHEPRGERFQTVSVWSYKRIQNLILQGLNPKSSINGSHRQEL